MITSSPAPILDWIMVTTSALVPLTTIRQRLAPVVSAHFFSNSSTTSCRDHTPLLITSNSLFSSVSGFHIGHFGQTPVNTGLPPTRAGVSEKFVVWSNRDGVIPEAKTAPRPIEFCFKNSRLDCFFFCIAQLFIWQNP